MKKKLFKYIKFLVSLTLILSLVAPSYASLSASDGSAFVTKAEFDSALADFNSRLTTFEAGINSKIDSQVTSYLDRNGIWSGKSQPTIINNLVIRKWLFNVPNVEKPVWSTRNSTQDEGWQIGNLLRTIDGPLTWWVGPMNKSGLLSMRYYMYTGMVRNRYDACPFCFYFGFPQNQITTLEMLARLTGGAMGIQNKWYLSKTMATSTSAAGVSLKLTESSLCRLSCDFNPAYYNGTHTGGKAIVTGMIPSDCWNTFYMFVEKGDYLGQSWYTYFNADLSETNSGLSNPEFWANDDKPNQTSTWVIDGVTANWRGYNQIHADVY